MHAFEKDSRKVVCNSHGTFNASTNYVGSNLLWVKIVVGV